MASTFSSKQDFFFFTFFTFLLKSTKKYRKVEKSKRYIFLMYTYRNSSLPLPTLPTLSDTSTAFPAPSINLTSTIGSPYHITDSKKATYYHGISPDPPKLLYHSDLKTNPFPIPKGRFPHLPVKTVHGVFKTQLNIIWDVVGPQIHNILKSHKIHYTATSGKCTFYFFYFSVLFGTFWYFLVKKKKKKKKKRKKEILLTWKCTCHT